MKTISWIAVIISIISLTLTLYVCFVQRIYDVNYIGIIISALGVLTTLLIGYNIYVVIDAKNFKKEMAKTLDEQRNETGALIYQMHAQSLFYNMHNPKEAIMQIMQAVELASKLPEKDTLGGIISFIVRMRNDLNAGGCIYKNSVKFNSDTIDKYCQLLKETNNPQALEITGFIRSLEY